MEKSIKEDNNEVEKVKQKKNQVKWLKPKRKPTEKEQRSMLGKALELLIITCMDNHAYKFGNIVRVQKEGGPIGLKLTGEIADCLMIQWDKLLLEELRRYDLDLEIYTRFKDDIQIGIQSSEKGSELKENKIVVNVNKKEADDSKTDNVVTMEIVLQIANRINPMIQLTVETPCNSENNKLAVLDVMVNVNEIENNRVDFEFYEKPTKNPTLIMVDSALNFKTKRTVLTQECLRQLRNTKIEFVPEYQKKHLNNFMLKMKNSGYGQKFRKEILDSTQKAHAKIIDEDKSGAKPIYRSRDWNRQERESKKSLKKMDWWNSEKAKVRYKSVLFVSPTPGGF